MNSTHTTCDIVVYGGTASAISAALQADRMGKKVTLVSPEKHLGGMVASGLGWTDSKDGNAVGGIAREFHHRVWKHYSRPEAWVRQDRATYEAWVGKARGHAQPGRTIDDALQVMWTHEPHVAEKVFEEMLAESGVTVHRGEWLDRESGVETSDSRIRSIRMLSGSTYTAAVFIDATYEGDLMAAAGVTHRVGRDSSAEFDECYNGIHFFRRTGNPAPNDLAFDGIDPYRVPRDPSSGFIAGVQGELSPGEKPGDADSRLQAFNFRLCLTNDPGNRVPFEKPDNYKEADYELLFRLSEKGVVSEVSTTEHMPNGKTDTNNGGVFGSDFVGGCYSVEEGWNYSEAGYEKRREIIQRHMDYTKGLLWSLANHPRIPEERRAKWSQYGLAADEFPDNGHWPHQLYVREARRMWGEFIMTQHHYTPSPENPIPDSIGLGSYSLDCHRVRRVVVDGKICPEGGFYIFGTHTYPISYRSILPKRAELQNLLVPVTLSATHVIFGSIRMEPTYMILGQSAGAAAALAVAAGRAVQDVPYSELAGVLAAAGQVLKVEEVEAKKVAK